MDFDSIDRIVDAYIENGANGLTILGMMGEAGKRSEEEFVAVFKRVNARNSVPVVVIMTALSNAAMDVGVAGVMAAPPSSLRTDALFINDYENTADAPGSAPFVLQYFPLATGVIISPDVILEIVADCPTCVMFKHENSPGLEKSVHCAQPRTRERSYLDPMWQWRDVYFLEEMQRRADGAMPGCGYPELMAQVVAVFRSGDPDRARDIFDAYMPMVRYEARPGLGLATL